MKLSVAFCDSLWHTRDMTTNQIPADFYVMPEAGRGFYVHTYDDNPAAAGPFETSKEAHDWIAAQHESR